VNLAAGTSVLGANRNARWRVAQWRGQFSGLTHATKVEDAEDTLRTAVAAFRAAGPVSAPAKAKAVRRLAARLLTVRRKALKARRAADTPVNGPSARFERLRQQEAEMYAAGVDAVLIEFGAADARRDS
jgi:hypothetical protein